MPAVGDPNIDVEMRLKIHLFIGSLPRKDNPGGIKLFSSCSKEPTQSRMILHISTIFITSLLATGNLSYEKRDGNFLFGRQGSWP